MEPTDATEILERYEQAMEALRPAFEAWLEVMQQWWLEISELLCSFISALMEWWTEVRREALYRRLRRQHFPHRLARFLAARWPERWLPWPEGVD